MVFMPLLIKAAPTIASMLSTKQTQGKDASSQQTSFANVLESAFSNANNSSNSQTTVNLEEIKSSSNTILDQIKKNVATPTSYSMAPGIVQLPTNSSNQVNVVPDMKKLTAAADAFNSAVAVTPVKPLIEVSSQAAK
jgi:hypothetical protein